MTTLGIVRTWLDAEGWGVIDSAETPGGCWTHFSRVLVSGYRTLQTGQSVNLEWEAAGQDGYSYRSLRVWPADQRTVVEDTQHAGPSAAYRSTLTRTDGDDLR